VIVLKNLVSTLLVVLLFNSMSFAQETVDPVQLPKKKKVQRAPAQISPEELNPYSAEALNPGTREKKVPAPPHTEPGLTRITRKGEYIYKTQGSPQKNASSIRFGTFDPPSLENPDAPGVTFDSIYSSSGGLAVAMFDYEWQIFQRFGKLGLKAGSGISVANGKGRFKSDTTKEALEGFTFFLFPNFIGGVYRLDYFNRQPIIPYVEGGLYYFTFAETRDDDKDPKFGGALASYVAGGAAISLGFLDHKSMMELDSEFGINNVYLVGEFRKVIGMNSKFDFTTDLINGGFLFEF
jgi:hypothetical protein